MKNSDEQRGAASVCREFERTEHQAGLVVGSSLCFFGLLYVAFFFDIFQAFAWLWVSGGLNCTGCAHQAELSRKRAIEVTRELISSAEKKEAA